MDALCQLILELYRAARETPVEEFQELALALVKTQLSFRTAMWGTCETTDEGPVVNSVHLHNEPLEVLHDWASFHLHDPLIDVVLANPGHAQIGYSPEVYHHVPDMLDFTQRYGHANVMIMADVGRNHSDGHLHGEWLGLYRADKQANFGQADQRIMENLMPHLVEALAINRMLGSVQLAHADSGLAGTRALARRDGTLYNCGKKFSGFLREIWPELKNGRLPEKLMAALVPGKEIMLAGHDIAVTSSALGNNMVLLNARRVSPLSKLSRRKLAAARLFGQGKSYKEVALQLGIAPSTAHNFLSSAYRKLNINDKAELAALIKESALY